MAILTIRTVGDPVLRTVCDDITVFDEALQELVADMLETMYEVNGVGLAGPQVGISKRIFTYGNIDGREGHVINPVIEVGDEPQEGGEGCLSVPGLSSDTPRKNWAKVTGVDMFGAPVEIEGEGLFARMLQHETDHLYGKMFIDRVVGDDKKRIMRAIRNANYDSVAASVQDERANSVSSGFSGAAFGGQKTNHSRGASFGSFGSFGQVK